MTAAQKGSSNTWKSILYNNLHFYCFHTAEEMLCLSYEDHSTVNYYGYLYALEKHITKVTSVCVFGVV